MKMWKYLAVILGILIGLLSLFLPEGDSSELVELWMLEDDIEEVDE